MAFKIARTPTFKAKVTVRMANNKGGIDASSFMAEFHRADTEELNELNKLLPKEVMERKLAGWSDLLDEGGQPVEFNELNREIVCKIPEALLALRESFWDNVVIAREKN